MTIKLKDVFGFVDQENKTYGLGYSLTLKRNHRKITFFTTTAGADAAKKGIKNIGWYIPHYTPSLENQSIVMDRLLDKDTRELHFIERCVYRENVNTNSDWTLEMGNSGKSTPTFVTVGYQGRNKN